MNKRTLCVGAVALAMISVAMLSAPAQAGHNGDRPPVTGIYDFDQSIVFNEVVTVEGVEYGVNFDGTLFELGPFYNATSATWYEASKGPSACVADWSDDLILHQWKDGQKVRTEVVLRMPDLNKTEANLDATAYTIRAHFTIEKVDANGAVLQGIYDGTTWEGLWIDGPSDAYTAEINQAGQLLYGYNWDTKNDAGGAGLYRLTFSIDAVEDVVLSAEFPYSIESYEDVSIEGVADSSYVADGSACTLGMDYTPSSTSIIIELL